MSNVARSGTRRIVYTSLPETRIDIERELAGIAGIELVNADENRLVREIGNADAVMFPIFSFDKALGDAIRNATPRLNWLQLLTAGYDKLIGYDVPPGLTVSSAGDSLAPAVADHAVTLLLALRRRLRQTLENQRGGVWTRDLGRMPAGMSGATVLIFGFGGIGQAVAQRVKAFGTHVIAVNRSGRPAPFADEIVPASGFDDALGRADAVIVACDLNDETRNAIDARRLSLMKPGALLVNIARGGVVVTDAVVAALKEGRLGGAGLDVTEPEPLPAQHALWNAPNVIVTPHIAGSGSSAGIAAFVRGNVERWLAGQPVQSIVKF